MEKPKTLTWTELRVGSVVIVSALVLAATVLYIGGGGSPFAPRYELRALMADVNGLKPGAPVRVGGVEVGSVTRVAFSPGQGGLVEVAMRLDGRVRDRVTSESRVTLGALGLLGEKAVDISSSSTGVALESGALVPAQAEDPFKGLLSNASDSTAYIRRILSRMDAGEGLIGKALRDEEFYTRMLDVSVRLQKVLDKLESPRGPLGRLVNDEELASRLGNAARALETAAVRLESGEGTLGTLSRDPAMATDLRQLVRNLGAVAERLEAGQGAAGRLLRDETLAKRLDSVAGRLDAVLGRLERGEGSAGRLLQSDELHASLVRTLDEARELVGAVRRDPKKYLRVKLSLF